MKEVTTRLKNTLSNSNMFAPALLLLVVTASAVLIGLNSVSAQNNQSNGGQGLSISPPLISLEADPGDTVDIDITLRNITGKDMVVRGQVNDFVAKDESGEPMILLDDDEDSAYSLKKYISSIPELQVAVGEQVVATVPVTIPANASPGAHMGVIRFSGVTRDSDIDGSQVSLSASVGTLVLINVSGDVNEDLSIEELAVMVTSDDDNSATKIRSTDKETNSGLIDKGPLTVVVRLANDGNVYMQPQGSIKVTNMFGREVSIMLPDDDSDDDFDDMSVVLNANKRNVLPESIRRFEQPLDKELWFGRYTLTVDIEYGSDQETASKELVFWVVPYKHITVALLVIVALVFFGIKAIKTYNRRVVAKFQQRNK